MCTSRVNCTDPRTLEKHEVYQEWADAYSCTRHRCQPGGRNLAIYTVGCKRVEAPESAIECEEVVEDTNMQFPYCCTRLRCLVVVRGEVWTKVLGQPWESLPAAPWSHMYKMKKPPPIDDLPKNAVQGPVYEIQSDAVDKMEKVLRSSKQTTDKPDCHDVVPRVVASPDIVIALATGNEEKEHDEIDSLRRKRPRKPSSRPFSDDSDRDGNADIEEATEKIHEISDEKYYAHEYAIATQKPSEKHMGWTEIPQNQWNEHEAELTDTNVQTEDKPEKQSGLQALVDAIGNRMRDIENVVQKMSEKVQKDPLASLETRYAHTDLETSKHRIQDEHNNQMPKKPNPDGDHYKRFSVRNRSRYLATTEVPIDQPLFVEDNSLNGYFSDASNTMRRSPPKEPATYMAPVETRRKHSEISDDVEKRRRKHSHKKKHGKGKGHKKHHGKEEKKKHFNRLSSAEVDKNVVSLEDSGPV
ncbi:uncharacterized protein LOC119836442 isoform X2 [Zerene cesonia]|uniref:uncharacterized protein LOC119836442 isoform X2 n=1 Tax=Zerene cesonia TaxID=33412 RepID=UPI0018E4EE6E|nr:uncharacterized protein LOC119836442 isoform X2 [Zerene cesonia]